jgi:hypothetical protein
MRHTSLVILSFLACLSAPDTLRAQGLLVEDTEVLLRIPAPLFHRDKGGWSGPRYITTVEVSTNGVSVDGLDNWVTAGFPILVSRTVSKIRRDEESNTTTVDLKSQGLPTFRLTIVGDANAGFAAIAAPKGDAERVRAAAYAALAKVYFVGPLADLSDATQHLLLTFAELTAKGTRIGSVTFKDKLYLLIDLGEDGSVYNDLKLNQAQRTALVLNERLLVILKAFAAPVREASNIQGLKLEYNVLHRSFANQYAEPEHDKLEVYSGADDIRRFAEADITSQQLVDNSIIIVNSNRIQVPLAQ